MKEFATASTKWEFMMVSEPAGKVTELGN